MRFRPGRSTLLGLIVLLTVTGGWALAAPSAHAIGPISSTPAASSPTPGNAPHVAVHPSVTPTCADPAISVDGYLNTVGVGGMNFYPFFPYEPDQAPCTLSGVDPNASGVFNDELHATFSSPVAGSAQRWSVPLRLPIATSTAELNALNDFYVGMVVGGDSSSIDGQSYVQVVFTPGMATNGSEIFNVTLTVLSLYDTGYCDSGSPLPTVGLNLTWEGNASCEADVMGGGLGYAFDVGVPAGQYMTATFVGSSTSPVTIYLNDTTQKKYSVSYTLSSSSVTGSHSFDPYYSSSCVDECLLNWSMPFGEGFGVDLSANSYNITYQQSTDPVWIGSPEYFTSGAYSGDFSVLSLESASGGCEGSSLTIPCPGVTSNWGYPYFQTNGTYLLFGSSANYNWTTRDFGGPLSEFESQGQPTNFDPMQLDKATNASQVGFLASGQGLGLTVRAQDLGHVSSVVANYVLPSGGRGSVTLGLASGNSSIGTYSGTLPAGGGDGTISFNLTATSDAGTTERVPVNPHQQFTVKRGAIPNFNITLETNPSSVGSINFDGLVYPSGSTLTLPANAYTASERTQFKYAFSSWTAYGIPLSLQQRTLTTIPVNLTANATLIANFKYDRPLDTISVAIDTNHCGSLTLNGTTYSTNRTIQLLDGKTYTLSFAACAQNQFSGWLVSDPSNLSILGGVPSTKLTVNGNGTLELTFLPDVSGPLAVTFDTSPVTCGGVRFQGAGYTDGATVNIAANVAYAVGPYPCAGWGLARWNTTAGLSINSGFLSAVAPGVVTAYYFKETIVTIETYPTTCGFVTMNGVAYQNGTQVVVTNGSTYEINALPCAGYSFNGGWYQTGGVLVTGGSAKILGSGILEAVFSQGAQTYFVTFITEPAGCGGIQYDGSQYAGSGYLHAPPNSVATILAEPCAGSGFVGWTVGGAGITIACLNCSSTIAYVNGSGSIQANFHQLQPISIDTFPLSCGAVVINSVPYTSNTTALLPSPGKFAIGSISCPHYQLAYFAATSGASISVANHTLSITSAAIVTAVFEPSVYALDLILNPGNCGGTTVELNGVASTYSNNTTLDAPFGSYNVTAQPCQGFHLDHWATSGGVRVGDNSSANTTVLVNASGELIAVFAAVIPVLNLAAPPSAFSGEGISFTANVSVPVPPFNYLYNWSFGDGSPTVSTPTGFVTHTFALPGVYIIHLTVLDPYHRVAYANSTITIVAPSGNGIESIGTAGFAAIGIVGLIVVLAVVAGLRRNGPRAPAEPGSGSGTPKPSSPPSDTPGAPDGT